MRGCINAPRIFLFLRKVRSMENANKIDFDMTEKEFQDMLDELSNSIVEIEKIDDATNSKYPMCA